MRRARAFGIDIATPRALPALAEADRAEGEATRVLTTGTGTGPDDWPHDEAVLIEDASDAGGVAIASHPELGFRIEEPTGDTYRISADGLQVRCSFASLDDWWRQRFLCSRVLPLAATLRGRELLHAGCVGIDDRAIAFVGPSFAGKSSLTLQMALRGAAFLTDDLLGVEVSGGPPSAHPGLALAGVRHAERDVMPDGVLARLHPVIDEGGKVWVAPTRATGALPLTVIYLLVRDADAGELEFEHLPDPDPRLLLSASFFSRLEVSPKRLTNHLVVSAGIARSVPVIRTVIPENVGAAELAGRILARESGARRETHAA